MAVRPRVGVLVGQGINAEGELARAFARAGALVERLHVLDLLNDPTPLDRLQILAFPGGFSYGDHLGAGKVLALELGRLRDRLLAFAERGLILGICNGFQVLTRLGLLPMVDGQATPQAALAANASGRFVDRWVEVRFPPSRCVWTRSLQGRSALLPVRHGEGNFHAPQAILDRLEEGAQVAVRYSPSDNPNGSALDIAGVCDPSGRILGLMPHPEAFCTPLQSPRPQGARIADFEGGGGFEASAVGRRLERWLLDPRESPGWALIRGGVEVLE